MIFFINNGNNHGKLLLIKELSLLDKINVNEKDKYLFNEHF